MKKFLITLLFVGCAIHVSSQNYKFGKVSLEELQEQFYPLDSTSDAAYLFESRRTFYDFMGGLKVITDIHKRIKIYSKEGFNQATQEIGYYKDGSTKERIGALKAYTYSLENGKIIKTKVEKDQIFDEEKSEYFGVKKVTFPKIKEGVVLEIKYSITSPFLTNIDDIEIQKNIPVKNQEM